VTLPCVENGLIRNRRVSVSIGPRARVVHVTQATRRAAEDRCVVVPVGLLFLALCNVSCDVKSPAALAILRDQNLISTSMPAASIASSAKRARLPVLVSIDRVEACEVFAASGQRSAVEVVCSALGAAAGGAQHFPRLSEASVRRAADRGFLAASRAAPCLSRSLRTLESGMFHASSSV
jgi:hypothetical protein